MAPQSAERRLWGWDAHNFAEVMRNHSIVPPSMAIGEAVASGGQLWKRADARRAALY
jgi:hypothetical protein